MIKDLFSRRGKALPDVYTYDLPKALRVQIIHLWDSAIGPRWGENAYNRDTVWNALERMIAEEHRLFRLGEHYEAYVNCRTYFYELDNVERALDMVEATFRVIDSDVRASPYGGGSKKADGAIETLNFRFREHGIGYQYVGGKVIRVDAELVHQEIVRPALRLLHDAKFKGAEEEFLNAHGHYRHGRYKEALNDALKAFESTMKAICDDQKWKYPKAATAKPLLDVLFQNGLIDSSMQSHFSGLRTTLEAGVPPVRNKLGGHGQGATPVIVLPHVASYALHLAATNIVFLVEAHKAKA